MKRFYFLFLFIFLLFDAPSAFSQNSETFDIEIRHTEYLVPNNPMFQKPRINYEVNGSGQITVDSEGKIHGQGKLTYTENYESEQTEDTRVKVVISSKGSGTFQIYGKRIKSYLLLWFEEKEIPIEGKIETYISEQLSKVDIYTFTMNPAAFAIAPILPEMMDLDTYLKDYIESSEYLRESYGLTILKRQNGGWGFTRLIDGLAGYSETIITTRLEPSHVVDVAWEAIDSPLDKNPNLGGGKRIFPGKTTPSDTVDRRKVRVRAKVEPPTEGVEIFFKAYDVDDPSSNAAPIDNNGPLGNDNYGLRYFGQSGQLNATSSRTNAEGEATVDFTVTTQPGDDFKVAASTEEGLLENLHVEDTDFPQDPNKVLPIDEVKISERLTVWRKLHIEVDSMGEVTGNEITGYITDFDPPLSDEAMSVIVDTKLDDGSTNFDDFPMENGRFENGTIEIAGSTVMTGNIISGLDGNGDFRIERKAGMNLTSTPLSFIAISESDSIAGTIGSIDRLAGTSKPLKWLLTAESISEDAPDWASFQSGTIKLGTGLSMTIDEVYPGTKSFEVQELKIPFVLKDDDQLTGDVPMPDTGLLKETFAPAYVLPVYDVGDNNTNVPFILNFEYAETEQVIQKVFDFDAINTEADNDFWTIYLLGAYQPGVLEDFDPNSEQEESLLGEAYVPIGAVIFMEIFNETMPDILFSPAQVTAHEVGHLFAGEHEDLDLMADLDEFTTLKFSDVTLDRIRRVAHP